MDEKELTLIHSKEKVKEETPKVSRVTNPILKKFADFHQEKVKFSVKDLFKA